MRGENDSPVEIYKSVSIERFDLKSTHEEADNFLAHQMVTASQENQKGISVVSDDTDVFVLLLYHYKSSKPRTTCCNVISHQRESCH